MRALGSQMHNHLEQSIVEATRREFLTSSASGLGGLALSAHLASELSAEDNSPQIRSRPGLGSHFRGQAKSCIFIYLAGAPSHLELYSPKPTLKKFNGQQLPDSLTKGVRFAFINKNATLMASKRPYQQHGESGMWFSDRLPHVSRHADDICMIQTMHSEAFNHHPAQMLMCCGQQKFGLPSMGAWLNYGLGAPSKNLPGYIVLAAGPAARGGATLYSSGFLPSTVAGVLFRSQGEPVLNLNNPKGLNATAQRISLDALKDLNRGRFGVLGDQEINSRIAAYELAFRMQSSAPDLIDLSGETKRTLESYGVSRKGIPGDFSRNCLLARRMVERGVRFINIFHGGWDAHGGLEGNVANNCNVVDQPVGALLADLKQRGLLDSTLVVWGTEFGRTPLVQGKDGRDHHPHAFPIWMAGGGARGGYTHGRTDELGWSIEEDPVHINDFQATVMRMFGIDDKKLVHRFKGLDFRLTGVGDTGHVVPELIG